MKIGRETKEQILNYNKKLVVIRGEAGEVKGIKSTLIIMSTEQCINLLNHYYCTPETNIILC